MTGINTGITGLQSQEVCDKKAASILNRKAKFHNKLREAWVHIPV